MIGDSQIQEINGNIGISTDFIVGRLSVFESSENGVNNYMGATPWYVEVLIRSKQLPALKLGQHYTILREDLDAFLDRKREELRGGYAADSDGKESI